MKSSMLRVLGCAALSIGIAACATQQQTGALIGGATGAAVGSTLGKGGGKTAAIILGAIAGTAIGASIGQHMDEQDRVNTAAVMESNPTGRTSTWVNPDTRTSYSVTPTRTYDTAQGPCREFNMNADVGSRPQQVYGTACRQPDGSWKIVQ